MGWQFRKQYDLNKAMGIPNHPPCDVCGKIDGGVMSGSGIGKDYRVCGDKCYKRLEMRLNNGLALWDKGEETREQSMRIRIKQLKHQLKSAGIKPKILECRDFNCEHNKDYKCTLEKVRLVVIENELVCENADEATNAGISYI